MLKKELTIPGARIQVNPVIKDGLPKSMFGDLSFNNFNNPPKTHISLMQDAGSFLNGHAAIYPGELLTIVRGPKKTMGINTCTVKTSAGVVGHVYWCELRASCRHI